MKSQSVRRQGFTVIEVVLFLAVTGLMLMGILIGVGGAVSRQQYEDTVTTLIDYYQGQFSAVDNVRSNRAPTARCGTASGVVGGGQVQNVGTSIECSIVGRLVRSSDGRTITSEPVYATADIRNLPQLPSGATERDYIDALRLRIVPSAEAHIIRDDIETYPVPWNAGIFVNGNQSEGRFSLLIIKLPSNGLIRTYGIPGYESNPATIISGGTSPLRICVANTAFRVGQPRGVRIMPVAPNISGVQRIGDNDTTEACS